jgi:putative glycosyltransferase (TIGR04372 family)
VGYLIIGGRAREVIEPWIDRGMSCKSGAKLTFSYLANLYLGENLSIELDDLLDPRSNRWKILPIDRARFIRSWSFWRLNHRENRRIMTRLLKNIEDQEKNIELKGKRYLPEYTTNMGHLGCLFLYIKYYAKIDPEREIHLWPDSVPNEIYLDKLIELSPLIIHKNRGLPEISELDFLRTDNLLMSRTSVGKWRFEANGAAGIGQSFPEYEMDEEFKIMLNDSESKESVDLLEAQGFDTNRWFVILHIREDTNGYSSGGQARDADILNYERAIETIYNLGGQVVRMGNGSFPKVKFNTPIFDYAHSIWQKEILDCWFWANCRWWMGNANGASFAVLAFNKPRIITDQWFWDGNGRPIDMFIPKLLMDTNSRKFLTPTEVILSSKSRCMDKTEISEAGYQLISNSPEILAEAAKEMFENIENSFIHARTTKLELEIFKALEIPFDSPKMRLPTSFILEYSKLLSE